MVICGLNTDPAISEARTMSFSLVSFSCSSRGDRIIGGAAPLFPLDLMTELQQTFAIVVTGDC